MVFSRRLLPDPGLAGPNIWPSSLRGAHRCNIIAGPAFWAAMLFFAFASQSAPNQEGAPSKISMSEFSLRQRMTQSVVPIYPPESLKKKIQGVVVVEIELNADAELAKFAVLQAPNTEIAQSAEKAVRLSKFKKTTIKGTPISVVGKLTFYFEIKDGRGLVKIPYEESAKG